MTIKHFAFAAALAFTSLYGADASAELIAKFPSQQQDVITKQKAFYAETIEREGDAQYFGEYGFEEETNEEILERHETRRPDVKQRFSDDYMGAY